MNLFDVCTNVPVCGFDGIQETRNSRCPPTFAMDGVVFCDLGLVLLLTCLVSSMVFTQVLRYFMITYLGAYHEYCVLRTRYTWKEVIPKYM